MCWLGVGCLVIYLEGGVVSWIVKFGGDWLKGFCFVLIIVVVGCGGLGCLVGGFKGCFG